MDNAHLTTPRDLRGNLKVLILLLLLIAAFLGPTALGFSRYESKQHKSERAALEANSAIKPGEKRDSGSSAKANPQAATETSQKADAEVVGQPNAIALTQVPATTNEEHKRGGEEDDKALEIVTKILVLVIPTFFAIFLWQLFATKPDDPNVKVRAFKQDRLFAMFAILVAIAFLALTKLGHDALDGWANVSHLGIGTEPIYRSDQVIVLGLLAVGVMNVISWFVFESVYDGEKKLYERFQDTVLAHAAAAATTATVLTGVTLIPLQTRGFAGSGFGPTPTPVINPQVVVRSNDGELAKAVNGVTAAINRLHDDDLKDTRFLNAHLTAQDLVMFTDANNAKEQFEANVRRAQQMADKVSDHGNRNRLVTAPLDPANVTLIGQDVPKPIDDAERLALKKRRDETNKRIIDVTDELKNLSEELEKYRSAASSENKRLDAALLGGTITLAAYTEARSALQSHITQLETRQTLLERDKAALDKINTELEDQVKNLDLTQAFRRRQWQLASLSGKLSFDPPGN